jgi:hypothetical protein
VRASMQAVLSGLSRALVAVPQQVRRTRMSDR